MDGGLNWREGGVDGRGIYVQTICGQSIVDNPVPVETADRSRVPFVAFEDTENQRCFGMSRELLSRGFLCMGPPGTGKTNLFHMMESRLLETMEPGAVHLIFDTKGDYYREHGGRVPVEQRYLVGSGEEYRDVTNYWNVFAEIMPRGENGRLVYTKECDVDALELAAALFEELKSEQQPIFPAMSEQLVAAILIYFMRKFWRTEPEKLNNREWIAFFSSKTNEDWKEILNEEIMSDQRSCLSYISGAKGNQTQGVNSYIASALRKVFIGPFGTSDPAREFSMREIIRSGKQAVIFVEYDLARGNTLSSVYKILIDQALKYALGGREEERKKLYLLIDEWALLPRLKHMASALNFGRAQGIRMMCGLQNVSAIRELYGEAGAENIMAGFQSIVSFRLTDDRSREFMKKRLGENYQNIRFLAQNNNMNIQRNGYCMEDWHMMNLGVGQAAVLLAGEQPFLFHFPRWR